MDELIEGQEQAIFADKSYHKEALRKECCKQGKFYGILAKGRRKRPLSAKQKRRNRILSRVRTKVEKVFGIFLLYLQREKARYAGLFANKILLLFLTCFTYNVLNLFWQIRRVKAFWEKKRSIIPEAKNKREREEK